MLSIAKILAFFFVLLLAVYATDLASLATAPKPKLHAACHAAGAVGKCVSAKSCPKSKLGYHKVCAGTAVCCVKNYGNFQRVTASNAAIIIKDWNAARADLKIDGRGPPLKWDGQLARAANGWARRGCINEDNRNKQSYFTFFDQVDKLKYGHMSWSYGYWNQPTSYKDVLSMLATVHGSVDPVYGGSYEADGVDGILTRRTSRVGCSFFQCRNGDRQTYYHGTYWSVMCLFNKKW